MVVWLVVLSMLVLCSIVVVVRQRSGQSPQVDSSSLALLQQQVEAMRSDMHASLHFMTENVQQQLNAVTQQVQSQTQNVGNRLDNAARVIGDVQKNLGELEQAAQEMKELGQSVGKLEELLRAPKLRGGLGEFLLEDLLKQILPADHFVMQYRFRSGYAVDAVIRTSDRLVPIDSKFPLENFRRILSSVQESEKKNYQKAFISDVKKHIDAIASKYILPDEGTFPFALMYIPSESIYYEIIINDAEANSEGVYGYAIGQKVIPVSPNSFYAYVQVVALGLRGLSIEHRAEEILDSLSRLHDDMRKVRDAFDVLGSHLENARKKYDEANKRISNFEHRLGTVVERKLPVDETMTHSLPGENYILPS